MRGGRRILLSGMGGELASLVAAFLERETWAAEIEGLDIDPPRRRLRRAVFHRVDPMNVEKVASIVHGFKPHVVVHLGVYEPGARASDREAGRWTSALLAGVMEGALSTSLEHIVVRSGITIYGNAARGGARPHEYTPIEPNSHFGRMLAEVEARATDTGGAARVPVGAVRLAPVIGAHVPSPLGRLLRLPVVPFPLIGHQHFSVVSDHDAAVAIVAAVRRQLEGPVNVTATGSVTPLEAIRRGRRIPVPLVGPQWSLATALTKSIGAPVPEHILELLHHGRLADTEAMGHRLGVEPTLSTMDVIDRLYSWPSVVRRVLTEAAA